MRPAVVAPAVPSPAFAARLTLRTLRPALAVGFERVRSQLTSQLLDTFRHGHCCHPSWAVCERFHFM